jgi:uncharacterized membrane protein
VNPTPFEVYCAGQCLILSSGIYLTISVIYLCVSNSNLTQAGVIFQSIITVGLLIGGCTAAFVGIYHDENEVKIWK